MSEFIDFIKRLFGCKTHYSCECKNVIVSRKGYDIILPKKLNEQLCNENISISANKYKGKPSCVQMLKTIDGDCKYLGTLKSRLNVKSFKDGNVCNFSEDNLIYNDKQ